MVRHFIISIFIFFSSFSTFSQGLDSFAILNQMPLINLGPDTAMCRYKSNLVFNINKAFTLPYQVYAFPCDTVKQNCTAFASTLLIANNNTAAMAGISVGKTNPFQLNVKGAKVQYLIKAKQMTGLELISAKTIRISRLTFFVKDRTGIPNGLTYNVSIKITCTNDSFIPVDSFLNSPNKKFVYTGPFSTTSGPGATLPTTTGSSQFTFNRGSYVWDKKSNLLIDICWTSINPAGIIPGMNNPTVEGINQVGFAGNNLFIDSSFSLPLIANICDKDSANVVTFQGTQPRISFGFCDNARPSTDFQYIWSSVPSGILTVPATNFNSTTNSTIPITASPLNPIPWKIKVQIKEFSPIIPNPNNTIDEDEIEVDIRFAPTFTTAYPDNTICSNEAKFKMNPFYGPPGIDGDRVYPLSSSLPGFTLEPDPITGQIKSYFDPSQAQFFSPIPSKFVYETKDGKCFFRDTTTLFIKRFDAATIVPEPILCIYNSPKNLTPVNVVAGAVFSGSGIVTPATGLFDPQLAGVGSHLISYKTPGVCGDSATAFVTVADRPKFLIGPTQIDGCSPFTVNFNTNGPSDLKKYIWEFQKNADPKYDSSNLSKPTYTFKKIGLNRVRLIAEDSTGCQNTTERYVNVFPVPEAKFTPSKREVTNVFGEVIFLNKTVDAEKFNWKIDPFLNLLKFNRDSLVYNFENKAGTFVVELIATNVEIVVILQQIQL